MLQKILCFIGYHSFTYKISEWVEEFGNVPLDHRMPKTAKCKFCSTKYHKEKKPKK